MAQINTEQKQRINLSVNAQDVIDNDRELFGPDLTKTGFFNELLSRVAPYAQASITETLERRREEYLSCLERTGLDEKTLQKVLSSLLRPLREALIEKAECSVKGNSVTFRLNNQNTKNFYPENWKDGKYYDQKPSRYLKAVLEEYAQHTLYEREALYFHEWITLTGLAIQSGDRIRFTSVSSSGKEREWDMRVYGILPNDGALFHYAVGYAVPKGGAKAEEKIASFRICRIRSLKILSGETSRSGKLTRTEKTKIEEKLQKDRVQFLVGEHEDCVVRLSEEGKRAYRSTQYMKPALSYIDEAGDYHFDCSPAQIVQYFYKFGRRALVLQPESARQRLAEEYRDAYEAYTAADGAMGTGPAAWQ